MNSKVKYINSTRKISLADWWAIQDTGNFIYLVKDYDEDIIDHSEEALKVYQKLNDQLIDKHGVGSTYMTILEKERQYLILINEGHEKNDDYIIWRAEKIEYEIKQLENQSTTAKREDSLIQISKFLGIFIQASNISVADYWTNRDYVDREIAKINAEIARQKKKKKR